MRKFIPLAALATLLLPLVGACSYVDAYEKAVRDWEPTYCYQSIGKATCFREPYHRDERRLVNYFGPHPSRYDAPEPPELAPIGAPASVNYWVKDAEPIPRPAPTGDAARLAWLDPAHVERQAREVEFAARAHDRHGTDALLSRMGIGPHGLQDGLVARPAAAAPAAKADMAPQMPKEISADAATETTAAPQGTLGSTAAEKTAKVPEQPAPPAQPVPPVIEVDVN